MIKLALFDLGETLLHDDTPFPNAITALEAIAKLKTASGEALQLGLGSDFLTGDPPGNEGMIATREQEYRRSREGAGLIDFLEPCSSRVTGSPRPGVFKPGRRLFELACS